MTARETVAAGARPAGLRIGTRGSALALIQARTVAAALEAVGVDAVIEIIETDGDRRAVDTPWGEGAFVTAIEQALLGGRVDVAVHSAKDIPTDEDPRLVIGAYLPRELPDDVIVLPAGTAPLRSLDDLPAGTLVGTDSPRRTAFLRAVRPDLRIHPLHGNVDTRLRRLDAGETGALVLAAAGLRRLDRADRISLRLPVDVLPPAPGQGALAVQVRAADPAVALVARLDDPATRRAVEAERAVLAGSGGGCRAPLSAFARTDGARLSMTAGLAVPDGRLAVTVEVEGDPGRGATALAPESIAAQALGLLVDRAEAAAARLGLPRVVVTRPDPGAIPTCVALVQRGFRPVRVPTIAVEPAGDGAGRDLEERLRRADWVVVTSANAVPVLAAAMATRAPVASARRRPRVAAVGEATARALRAAGLPVSFRPWTPTGRALADELPAVDRATVVLVRGDLADATLGKRLTDRGARVEVVTVYRTVECPPEAGPALDAALADGPPAAVVVASPSAVRGWASLVGGRAVDPAVLAAPFVAIGPTTAVEARRLGIPTVVEATSPAPGVVAETVAAAILAPIHVESR